jgi:hypothetical protein
MSHQQPASAREDNVNWTRRVKQSLPGRGSCGDAYKPSSFGIGADPGHQEHRSPSTSVPTEASGWRSTVRT